jgi:hypothetical protein
MPASYSCSAAVLALEVDLTGIIVPNQDDGMTLKSGGGWEQRVIFW